MSFAQFDINYDESKVPEFTAPDALTTFSGERIITPEEWHMKRRPEVHEFFETKVYGKVPGKLDPVTFHVLEQDENALDGKARRKQVEVTLRKNEKSIHFTLLIYLPKNVATAPVFLGYNFFGNHTVTKDENIVISDAWAMNNESLGIDDHKLTEASRGGRAHRWAIDTIIKEGFGLATIYYGEVDPDKNDMSDGIHELFYEKGQERPKPDEWVSLRPGPLGIARPLITYLRMTLSTHQKLLYSAIRASARQRYGLRQVIKGSQAR